MKKVVNSLIRSEKPKKEIEPLNQIDDFLFLGNQEAASSPAILEAYGIKTILQVLEMPPVGALEEKIQYLKLPIRGGRNTNIQPILQQSLRFIHAAVTSSQNILVHCKHGKNRSASIVIAYIMAVKSLTLFEAERYVRSKRTIVKIKDKTKDFLNRLGFRGLQQMMT